MKRMLFLTAMLILAGAGVQSAWAQYTTSDLLSDGWEAVDGTTVALTDLDTYYYLLVDGTETNKSLTYSGIGTDARPVYQLLYDPTVSVGQVWKLEASGDMFKLKSYANDYYYCSNSWGWNSYMGTNESYTEHEFVLNDGKYYLHVKDQGGTTRALGAWSDYNLNGGGAGYAGTAGNKDVGGSNDRGFYIYRILRTAFTSAPKPGTDYAAKGWMEVTAATDWGKDYLQYVFLDYSETGWETEMVVTATENGLPQYQRHDMTNKAQWWTTEASGSGYAFKSVEYQTYSNYTAPWGGNMSEFTPDNVFIPSIANGKWQIRNTSDNSNWWGRWGDSDNGKNGKNDPYAGESLAANKQANAGKRLFNVYAIPADVKLADPLPASGDMTAETWYFFDIDIAGSAYAATATSLDDIECIEYSTGNKVTLAATGNTLANTRYYVRSPYANNLNIAATSYSYTIGATTADPADGSVIKPGQTITVTFQAQTDDPGASLTTDFSGVTFGGAAAAVTATENGFTFVVPDDVTAGTPYTLEIPAGAVQYAGEASSEAASFSYSTPAFFDGVYYFRNTDDNYEYQYITRGGSWATRASVNDYGLATYISMGSDGTTTIQFFDSEQYLGDDGECYTDCTGGRVRSFLVEEVTGGYKFKNTNNNKYLAIYNGGVVADAVEGGNLQGTTNVWVLETPDEYASTCYARNAHKQVNTASTLFGLDGYYYTGADLEAEFTFSTDITIPEVERQEQFNKHGANNSAGDPYTFFEKTLTGLQRGIYKLTFKGMQRAATYARVDKAEGARGVIYAYANDAKTQLVSAMEEGADAAYASNYASTRTGLNYPNDPASTYAAFDAGLYNNEIYVFVGDEGTLTFGMKTPSRCPGNDDSWTVFGDFKLTYFFNDLSTLVDEYKAALAAAKTTEASTETMAPSIRTALAGTIDTYDEGKVDETSQAALEEAINALKYATAKAETSIASYDIIEQGGLPDDNVDGWVNTTNGVFHPNWWSTNVSDDDGGSGMTTTFLEDWIYRDNKLSEGKVYYRLEGLEPGEEYEVSALVRACNEATADVPDGPLFYANSSYAFLEYDGTEHVADSWASLFATLTVTATVGDDGVLEFGIDVPEGANYNWVALKNVTIGTPATVFFVRDDEDYDYAQGGEGDVAFVRTFIPGDFNTLVVPFSMDQDEIEAVFGVGTHVYLAESYSPESNNISLRTPDYDIDGVGVEKITANVPCVIKPTFIDENDEPIEETNDGIIIENRTVEPCETAMPKYEGENVTTYGVYEFTNAYEDGKVHYVMGTKPIYDTGAVEYDDVKLYLVDSDVRISPTRGFFELSGAPAGVKTISFVVDGEATGIAVIEDGNINFFSGKVYDLSGREVKNPARGIYIVGGKKVMIK